LLAKIIFMFPIIKTARLTLNKIELNDADSIFFLRSSPEVTRYIQRDPYTDVQQAVDFIEMITKQLDSGESVTWALRNSETNEMMGSICLWSFSEDRKTAEMGYDMKPEFQGKGHMSEAMKAIVNYGLEELGLTQIEAFTSQYNEPSKNLLLKNGFVLNPFRKDEDDHNNLIYELRKTNDF